MADRRQQRAYGHRLRELVHKTGDVTIATKIGVPRSTAASWLRAGPPRVVTLDLLDLTVEDLEVEVLELRRRVRILGAVVGLLLALLRVSGFELDGRPLPEGAERSALELAVERARRALPRRAVLRVLGISSSRFHSWSAATRSCTPDAQTSCPVEPQTN